MAPSLFCFTGVLRTQTSNNVLLFSCVVHLPQAYLDKLKTQIWYCYFPHQTFHVSLMPYLKDLNVSVCLTMAQPSLHLQSFSSCSCFQQIRTSQIQQVRQNCTTAVKPQSECTFSLHPRPLEQSLLVSLCNWPTLSRRLDVCCSVTTQPAQHCQPVSNSLSSHSHCPQADNLQVPFLS